jgi:hypothetical protein
MYIRTYITLLNNDLKLSKNTARIIGVSYESLASLHVAC